MAQFVSPLSSSFSFSFIICLKHSCSANKLIEFLKTRWHWDCLSVCEGTSFAYHCRTTFPLTYISKNMYSMLTHIHTQSLSLLRVKVTQAHAHNYTHKLHHSGSGLEGLSIIIKDIALDHLVLHDPLFLQLAKLLMDWAEGLRVKYI